MKLKYGKPNCPNCIFVGSWEEIRPYSDGVRGFEVYYCHDHNRDPHDECIIYRFQRTGEQPDQTNKPVIWMLGCTQKRNSYAWNGWGKAILLCAKYIDKRRLDEAFT